MNTTNRAIATILRFSTCFCCCCCFFSLLNANPFSAPPSNAKTPEQDDCTPVQYPSYFLINSDEMQAHDSWCNPFLVPIVAFVRVAFRNGTQRLRKGVREASHARVQLNLLKFHRQLMMSRLFYHTRRRMFTKNVSIGGVLVALLHTGFFYTAQFCGVGA